MNTEDIIAMAREAGFEDLFDNSSDWVCFTDEIERFAALVADAEREACARLASEPQCWPLPHFTNAPSERTMGRIEGEKEMSRRIAAAIRARGEQK